MCGNSCAKWVSIAQAAGDMGLSHCLVERERIWRYFRAWAAQGRRRRTPIQILHGAFAVQDDAEVRSMVPGRGESPNSAGHQDCYYTKVFQTISTSVWPVLSLRQLSIQLEGSSFNAGPCTLLIGTYKYCSHHVTTRLQTSITTVNISSSHELSKFNTSSFAGSPGNCHFELMWT